MAYTTEWLINEINKGKEYEFVLFWGHLPLKNSKIGKSCLSQWFNAPFIVNQVEYQTAEHWMMVEKARAFNDLELIDEILSAETPEIAKNLGRKIKKFDESKWNKYKYDCVKQGNLHKFSQNLELKNYLISTGNKILVEASPYDKIWGIGLGKENQDAINPEKWQGENLLGFVLMEVRDELK